MRQDVSFGKHSFDCLLGYEIIRIPAKGMLFVGAQRINSLHTWPSLSLIRMTFNVGLLNEKKTCYMVCDISFFYFHIFFVAIELQNGLLSLVVTF